MSVHWRQPLNPCQRLGHVLCPVPTVVLHWPRHLFLAAKAHPDTPTLFVTVTMHASVPCLGGKTQYSVALSHRQDITEEKRTKDTDMDRDEITFHALHVRTRVTEAALRLWCHVRFHAADETLFEGVLVTNTFHVVASRLPPTLTVLPRQLNGTGHLYLYGNQVPHARLVRKLCLEDATRDPWTRDAWLVVAHQFRYTLYYDVRLDLFYARDVQRPHPDCTVAHVHLILDSGDGTNASTIHAVGTVTWPPEHGAVSLL